MKKNPLIITTFLFQVLLIGQSDSVIKVQIDNFIKNKMDSLHIPGIAVVVVQNGKILYSGYHGHSNLELNTPVKPESQFLIGSISKSFTAVALMMLWEKNLFSLEDSIGKYLSEIPEHWQPLTIRQLLNHTSGIPTNLELPAPCNFEYDPDNYTRQNYFQEVTCLPLEFTPGSQWKYSAATGYDLLGLMIEKLSKISYYEFIREHIYGPSLMNESTWINYDSIIPNRVNGYYFSDGLFENSVQLDAIGEYAHGGLMSSVLDLIKFDDALFKYKLLKKSTMDLMFQNAILADGTIVPSYGLGFGLTPYKGHKRVGHTGSAPGFSTSYSRFIDDDLSIIMLTNKDSDYSILKLSNEIVFFFMN